MRQRFPAYAVYSLMEKGLEVNRANAGKIHSVSETGCGFMGVSCKLILKVWHDIQLALQELILATLGTVQTHMAALMKC